VLSSDHIHFGTLVRMGRAGLAWTQGELALHAGIASRTIKNVETGRKKPRSKTRERLIDALARAGAELESNCSVRIRRDLVATTGEVTRHG
jgi:DNA-binding XRE family transcriptional regulator